MYRDLCWIRRIIMIDIEKLRKMLNSQLSDAYYCNRVWEAWNFNTMSEDDFEQVDSEEIVNMIIEECCGENNA